MSIFSTLRKEHREAVGLLQMGTFLEYFDLMLYVHMAVILNDLFFPKTDPHTAALISAFAFCSTWILRPFGAIIFGYIGDNIGRKAIVVMTTLMMAVSCILMANLPTYAEIGIAAAWIVTGCRILQGLASMGEIIGATIYLTEITKPPRSYPIVAFLDVASSLGGVVALLVASIVTISPKFDWRVAFWIGASIAVIGAMARSRLKETLDYSDMQRRMKNTLQESYHDKLGPAAELLKNLNPIWKEKTDNKVVKYYFLMSCASPLCFYITYVFCGDILRKNYGFSPEEVIHQNLIISIFAMISLTITALLSYRVPPLSILKAKVFIMFPFLVLTPVFFSLGNHYYVNLIQFVFIVFGLAINPAYPVLLKYLPILRRFTFASMIYAVSRALTYIITTFGCVYLAEWFGYWGLLMIMTPISVGYYSGIKFFEKLEEDYPEYLKRQASKKPDWLKRLNQLSPASQRR